MHITYVPGIFLDTQYYRLYCLKPEHSFEPSPIHLWCIALAERYMRALKLAGTTVL
jgi:hypothetical protein